MSSYYSFKIKTLNVQKIGLKQGEYSMTCMYCFRTCHYPCTECGTNNKDNIIKCSAIKNGYCKNCGCNWEVHNFVPFKIETHEIEEEVTNEALKKEYFEAIKNKK